MSASESEHQHCHCDMLWPMRSILGQRRATDTLEAVLRSGRVHHAWIFAGPAGVGKFTTAVELARILLDPGIPAGSSGVGEVEADTKAGRTSQLVDAGTHPDFHVIRKELALFSENREIRERKLMNIPLDVLREQMLGGPAGDGKVHDAPAYRSAAHGHGKVFIIDEAELLDQYAQNALLKTLEEPPPETYIILITSRPDRLLPTIRSRCQIVQFQRLDAAAMKEWFERAKLELPAEQREWIDRFADGSPGAALLAAEYGFHRWSSELGPMIKEIERGRYPAAMGEALAALVEEFADTWVKNHKNASKDAANKDGARYMLAVIASYARRRLRHAAENGAEFERWTALIDVLRDAERLMYANVNLKMVLENVVVQWTQRMAVAA
jgi:DNA polymerase III subunit delta'